MKDRLESSEVAPHGWVRYGHVSSNLAPPEPRMTYADFYWVPAKPEPRVWEGTVRELKFLSGGAFSWGDDVRVRVVEVVD